jgi:DNA-binding protein Fis
MKGVPELSKAAQDKLMQYHFPGNVRELQYAIERAFIMTESSVLEATDILFSPIESSPAREALLQQTNLEELEKATIQRVIEKHDGNLSRAAKELGITRTALYRRLNKHDIKMAERWIVLRVLFLFITLCAASYVLFHAAYAYLVPLVPLILYQLFRLIRLQQKTRQELDQFVKSVQYRDFTGYFDIKHAPAELQPLRKGLNVINTTFRTISRERETQYHYLQKILEMVNTGILSYELESKEAFWMNEPSKSFCSCPT